MNREIESELKTKEAKDLYKTLAAIKNSKQMGQFLRDLLTLEEIEEATKRWQGAKMLSQKKTFREIAKQTGLSSATIARINYWIHHGAGGYREVLEKLT